MRYSDRVVRDVEAEQLKIDLVSVLSQFLARTMPDRRLCNVTLEPGVVPGGVSTMVVHLDDRKIPLFTGRVVVGKSIGSHESDVPPLADFMPDATGQPTASVVPARVVGVSNLIKSGARAINRDQPLGAGDE
jgi:hypothetical protein